MGGRQRKGRGGGEEGRQSESLVAPELPAASAQSPFWERMGRVNWVAPTAITRSPPYLTTVPSKGPQARCFPKIAQR